MNILMQTPKQSSGFPTPEIDVMMKNSNSKKGLIF